MKKQLINEIKNYSKKLYKNNLGLYPYTINRLICMLEDKDAYEIHRKYFFIGLGKLTEKDYYNRDKIMKIMELYEQINKLKKGYY